MQRAQKIKPQKLIDMKNILKAIGLIATSVIIVLTCSCESRTGVPADTIIPTPKEVTVNSESLVRINSIVEIVDPALQLPEGSYTLSTKGKKAILRAASRQGLVHARATLAQLSGVTPEEMFHKNAFRGVQIPDVVIVDSPAFPIRGFMHDNGRNFRDIETLKKELNLLAYYKINVFHWHLTDNPAWRIECHAYPQLNDPQYQRQGRDEGKFYTYDQIREVIAYAKERGIMVIPEIDMPGHSQYFNKTFGFGMASPEGMKVLEDCLHEFMQEIPAEDCPYIHIGSDEVYIADPKGFMTFCEGIVKADGRIPLAWYPGLPSSEETISQVWSEAGRMSIGESFAGPYLDSYMGYLNLGNPLINTSNFFLHQLCSVEEYDDKALGGILCLWNDVRVDDKSKLFSHNGMPEGLLSFAESSWKGGKGYGWHNQNLLPGPDSPAHGALQRFEKKIACHRDALIKEWDMRWVANSHIPWKVSIADQDGNEILSGVEAWGGCIDLNALCRANGIAPGAERIEATMTTELSVSRDTVITAWVGFDSPARSNRMSDGIGEQGKWEGSARVFAEDTEIFPPKPWNEPGKYRFHFHTWHKEPNEMPYTDEQFFWTREPAQIPLKAGKNTITISCPRVFNAAIWIAAFVPMTQDGNGHVSEATGI